MRVACYSSREITRNLSLRLREKRLAKGKQTRRRSREPAANNGQKEKSLFEKKKAHRQLRRGEPQRERDQQERDIDGFGPHFERETEEKASVYSSEMIRRERNEKRVRGAKERFRRVFFFFFFARPRPPISALSRRNSLSLSLPSPSRGQR